MKIGNVLKLSLRGEPTDWADEAIQFDRDECVSLGGHGPR